MKIFVNSIFILLLLKICLCNSEPFTIGIASTFIVGLGSYIFNQEKISCFFSECCRPNSKWLPMNMTKLEGDIKMLLHGQPLVEIVLFRHLKSHISNNNPSKALLLSFNGMPGTGKNFVSTMIAQSLFQKGMQSKFVHLFVSAMHFPLSKDIDEYRKMIQKKIIDSVKLCPRSMFIFDEVQDMPENLLDTIKPFVDNHESIDGIDFRKSIFILLSNSGGRDINTKLLEAHTSGRTRDTLTLKEMEDALVQNIYAMKNDGLRKSKLITHNLITAFVPFLPLDKSHVVLCIKNILANTSHQLDEELINQVVDSLSFEKFGGLLLAAQGCKRISEKLQLYL